MKPGRELDALVAEKVMGLKPTDFFSDYNELSTEEQNIISRSQGWAPLPLKHYSTDIAAAWTVFNALESRPDFVTFEMRTGDKEHYSQMDQGYSVRICLGNGSYWRYSESAPHAICLAALKTVGVET